MESSKDSFSKTIFQFNTLVSKPFTATRPKLKNEAPLSTRSILNITSPVIKAQANTFTPRNSLFNQSKGSKSEKVLLIKSIKKVTPKSIYEAAVKNIKFPTTPSIVISALPNLPEWIKNEMSTFKQLFYISKIEKLETMNSNENDGEFKAIIGDDIEYRYEILEVLGKGTFGQVVKVYDHMMKKLLAMKIIKNKQRYLDQSIIEVNILKFLQEKNLDSKANIVSFEGSFYFRNHMVNNI